MRRSKIRIRGPLTPHLSGLWRALKSQGYTLLSIRNLARLFADLSGWLSDQGLSGDALTRETIDHYARHRRKAGRTGHRWASSLEPVLEYLRRVGAAPKLTPLPTEPTANDLRLKQYRAHLEGERRLVAPNVGFNLCIARAILPADGDLSSLTAATVTRFVLQQSKRYSIAATKRAVTALRTLLRYLFLRGEMAIDLSGAVPRVAGWRLTGLPRDLEPTVVAHLLQRGCDGRTHGGRRARAAVLLMVRMGLRVGEVASLRLEDIDWRMGEVIIRGKGGRTDRLPLPADVGAAVAAYVRRSRPRTAHRALFMRLRAPHGPASPHALQGAVRAACLRAGVPEIGTHRLRHTAASQMLRQGSSLTEIAQVLRHRHVGTTAIYAKVDRVALQELAQPWPGGAQ